MICSAQEKLSELEPQELDKAETFAKARAHQDLIEVRLNEAAQELDEIRNLLEEVEGKVRVNKESSLEVAKRPAAVEVAKCPAAVQGSKLARARSEVSVALGASRIANWFEKGSDVTEGAKVKPAASLISASLPGIAEMCKRPSSATTLSPLRRSASGLKSGTRLSARNISCGRLEKTSRAWPAASIKASLSATSPGNRFDLPADMVSLACEENDSSISQQSSWSKLEQQRGSPKERRARTTSPANAEKDMGKTNAASSASRHGSKSKTEPLWTCDGRKAQEFLNRLPGAPGERHVFWTGGYDSTWRVVQALLIEGLTVVPIYLSGIIDNFSVRKHNRQSQGFELAAMKAIRGEILRCFPSAGANLKPLVVVPDVTLEKEVMHCMAKLKENKMVRRRRCQYGSMAQLTRIISTPIDVSVLEGDFLWLTLREHLEKVDNEWMLSQQATEQLPELAIFKWLRFPLMESSKESILEEAKQRGCDKIMQMTWTCWYPRPNGQQCGKCGMCKHRILW